jgi:hypothetical protein
LRGFHRRVRVAATMAEPDTMTPGKLRLAQAAMVVRDTICAKNWASPDERSTVSSIQGGFARRRHEAAKADKT